MAVNDAAGAGLSEDRVRAGMRQGLLDPALVEQAVGRSLEAGVHPPLRLVGRPQIVLDGESVTVRLEAETSYVFTRRTAHVRATATAALQEEPDR
jgi:hypothetical protein